MMNPYNMNYPVQFGYQNSFQNSFQSGFQTNFQSSYSNYSFSSNPTGYGGSYNGLLQALTSLYSYLAQQQGGQQGNFAPRFMDTPNPYNTRGRYHCHHHDVDIDARPVATAPAPAAPVVNTAPPAPAPQPVPAPQPAPAPVVIQPEPAPFTRSNLTALNNANNWIAVWGKEHPGQVTRQEFASAMGNYFRTSIPTAGVAFDNLNQDNKPLMGLREMATWYLALQHSGQDMNSFQRNLEASDPTTMTLVRNAFDSFEGNYQ